MVDTVDNGGWVLRKMRGNDKWVRRWLETREHLLCSYNAAPGGGAKRKVLTALDVRRIARVHVLQTDPTRTSFAIVVKPDDAPAAASVASAPAHSDNEYVFRADTPPLALHWVEQLSALGAALARATPAAGADAARDAPRETEAAAADAPSHASASSGLTTIAKLVRVGSVCSTCTRAMRRTSSAVLSLIHI